MSQEKKGNDNQGSLEAAASVSASLSFSDLGLMPELCEACVRLKYKVPTEIQRLSIPPALRGEDVIALAQTGSGKTAAFALPVLQALWNDPKPFFALVLAPTRELAFQIHDTFVALGSGIGVRSAAIVGGMDTVQQAIALARNPHIVVGTPGRLEEHLRETRGFSLKSVRYLILDEADRLLDSDFSTIIERILSCLPPARKTKKIDDKSIVVSRNTLLFSATMTEKVAKLQRASMGSNATRVSATTSRYDTVDSLLQYYIFLPLKHKDVYLSFLLNDIATGHSAIVFASTIISVQRLSLLLRSLGFSAVPLHGKMPQSSRMGALSKFKSGDRRILVATDVAARGLDIPQVDLVINYDVPSNSKLYVHRVGRTARAGRTGKAVTLVSQYDLEQYMQIETLLKRKLPKMDIDNDLVMVLCERVSEAGSLADTRMRELTKSKKLDTTGTGKRGRAAAATATNDMDEDGETSVVRSVTAKYSHLKSRKRNKKSFANH